MVEVSGIPEAAEDYCLEENIISVLTCIGINVESSDIEACHRIGKSRNTS